MSETESQPHYLFSVQYSPLVHSLHECYQPRRSARYNRRLVISRMQLSLSQHQQVLSVGMTYNVGHHLWLTTRAFVWRRNSPFVGSTLTSACPKSIQHWLQLAMEVKAWCGRTAGSDTKVKWRYIKRHYTTTETDLGIFKSVLKNAVIGRGDPRDVDGRRSCRQQLNVMRTLIGRRRHRRAGAVPRLLGIIGQYLHHTSPAHDNVCSCTSAVFGPLKHQSQNIWPFYFGGH